MMTIDREKVKEKDRDKSSANHGEAQSGYSCDFEEMRSVNGSGSGIGEDECGGNYLCGENNSLKVAVEVHVQIQGPGSF